MSHDYHEALPGFDPAQILHDGCDECEWRGAEPSRALSNLDVNNFKRAWERAAQWGRASIVGLSAAEAPLLQILGSLQVQFERLGLPIGALPIGALPLTPTERIAATVARNTAGRGEGITPNVALVVMGALDRLTGHTTCGGCGPSSSAERCESCRKADVAEDRFNDEVAAS